MNRLSKVRESTKDRLLKGDFETYLEETMRIEE